jgi:DNA polymerase IV
MSTPPDSPAGFPHAIVHIDGDAFFTSVEQALHPRLRGRPVVTGMERGIIACASYEAKARGVKRGVSLWDARRLCPELVVLPSDYESYSLFSKRMFDIMRRYTPKVEEYSIDEGFAELTGMEGYHRKRYSAIAAGMQQAINGELDLTVSVGLSLSKGLAKIASDFKKPNGLTLVAGEDIPGFLQRVPLADVWGLGRRRVALLERYGLKTAGDFAARTEAWIGKLLHKPGVEIWHELRGNMLLPVNTTPWKPQDSISKSKTFAAPSADRNFVYAKLIRNLESAFIKLRRYQLRTAEIAIALRLRDYMENGIGFRLPHGVSTVQEVIPAIRQHFDMLYVSGATYRATGIVLGRLEDDRQRQYELFEEPAAVERQRRIGAALDSLRLRHGKHAVFLATGLALHTAPSTDRDTPCWRRLHLLRGETSRRRIRLPVLDLVV